MDDLISRQDALKAICKACYSADDEDYTSCESYQNEENTFCDYKQSLLQVPSAQPKPQWIPCSERLPPLGEEVLVWAYDRCHLLTLYAYPSDEGYYWYWSAGDYDIDDTD